MYSLRQLLRGLRSPRRVLVELNGIVHERLWGVDRVDVMARDWDTLVLLDGCRYDTFAAATYPPGDLESVVSRGSSTPEFLVENFRGRTFPDTVYVTANPQLVRFGVAENFHACVHVWREGWEEDLGTVPPAAVTEAASEAHRQYPNKRLIVHYMQPHFPFIGETGRDLRHRAMPNDPTALEAGDEPSIWDRLEAGDLERATVERAYRENLDLVLESLASLLPDLDGRTVISSDHGNAFGEWGVYGHPGNHYIDALVRVPWLVLPASERREIVAGDVDPAETTDDGLVAERLEALGYR